MYDADPEGVIELFTTEDFGAGDYIADKLNRLAASSDSDMQRRYDSIRSRQELFEDRIEHLDELLAGREERLYAQFYAMEQAISKMQSQQGSLSMLSNMAKPG